MTKKIIKICLWLLAFVPLAVSQTAFFPEVTAKNLLIETGLVLVAVLFVGNFIFSTAFRTEISDRSLKLIKNPLLISLFSFVVLLIISTIFAVDKYSALWGSPERAEGLAGILFFFAFFVFGLLVFERKDWLWFFKLSLFTSLILLGREFFEALSGIARPGSLIGNPEFLAGYLLFSITSAVIVFNQEKNKFWKYLSVISTILAFIGIFITQTRGTILGLVLGVIAVLIYFAIKGKGTHYYKVNLRKASLVLLALGLVFAGIFFATRNSELWQKVPGLSRLAITNTGTTEDFSTAARLYIYRTSLAAVNPGTNGIGRLLIGWGPENFVSAEAKYYDAGIYKYETGWHDRAHNKILDVLVTSGILGLIAYLLIWFFFFKSVVRKGRGLSWFDVSLLFFGISFLVHLLFAFDQISTSIPFFAILAFSLYSSANNDPTEPKIDPLEVKIGERETLLTGSFLVILGLFLVFTFLSQTVPAYWQTASYFSLIKSGNLTLIEDNIDSLSSPFTIAQAGIVGDFLRTSSNYYGQHKDPVAEKLLAKALNKSEAYLVQRPADFIFMVTLADVYSNRGDILKNSDYIKKGESYFRKILDFAPNRPDVVRGLAINLLYQKRYEEAFVDFERAFDLSPSYFDRTGNLDEGIYTSFIRYFYVNKDKDNFIKAVNRLKLSGYKDYAPLDKIIDYLNKNGVWPKVNFE